MKIKAFLDSNVIIYALGTDTMKKSVAVDLIKNSTIISTQVLNEVANVMRRKLKYSFIEIRSVLDLLCLHCFIKTIEPATIFYAIYLAERYLVSHYDSLMLASALEAGCEIIYSEDLQHGQIIENRLMIKNPFTLIN